MKIRNLELIPATGKQDNQFVGIRIRDNRIEFHYPETYTLSDSDAELRKDILSILRTVSLAKTKTKDMSSYNTAYSSCDTFPVGAYLWIINDYLTYGRYENREKVYSMESGGKVNWARTLHSNPIVSKGNIIYDRLVFEKKTQIDNLLTEIYNFCVKKAVDSIGWLYNVSFDSSGVDYYRKFNRKLYMNAVNTELSHTFDDKKKTRLVNMKNIITGLDDSMINTRDVIYGVDSYEYVYERLVDYVFSNVDNIKSFYPSATWELVLENGKKDSSNLRPDTVVIKDKKVYILDAKYYRYGTTFSIGDIPETTSIQKQITYGEYVKKVKEGQYDDVYSAFVMPYSMTENAHNDIFRNEMEFAGIAEAKWIDSSESNSRKIAAVLVDTKYLIGNYLRKRDEATDMLIDIIEKKIGQRNGI